MARKKKFQARVEVYFIIYIATIVSFFAIEGEVKHFKDNQKKILLEVSKDKIQNTKTPIIVLAWNYFDEIKKNNHKISDNFINIKELEKNNFK